MNNFIELIGLTLKATGGFIALVLLSNPTYSAEFDSLGRLISIEGKIEVSCPAQNQSTAVILALGQSLVANHASQKFTTKYPDSVLNYFDGKCYVAASPLLGATSQYGEFLTPLGDLLIESRQFSKVILIPAGIGGTAIIRWQQGGDLNEMVSKIIDEASSTYKITAVIWQQGESDFLERTTTEAYTRSFESLSSTLAFKNISAPIFIAISSKCGPTWIEKNPITIAQKQLIDHQKIYLGVNSDLLLDVADRTLDECHLMGSGQTKLAESYAKAIVKIRSH